VLLGLFGGILLPIVAQQPEADDEESVFFPTDRATLQRLAAARQLLDEERYDEAVRLLDNILQAPEDFFFQPTKGQRIYRSVKAETQRLLGQLPARARASYELQFGPQARQMLEQAARDANPAGLAEVSRRFFHTKAGYEATELFATDEMEHGRPLAAALAFKRLADLPQAAQAFEPLLSIKLATCWLRAGMPTQALAALGQLGQRDPEASVVIAGHERRIADLRKEGLAWLSEVAGRGATTPPADAQWLMAHGRPDRNAASPGSSPLLNPRWAISSTNDPRLDKLIEQVRQSYTDQGIAALPGCQPLAVGDLVILRSATGLVAVDFKTGKRVWRGASDDAVKAVLDVRGSDRSAAESSLLASWLDQRLLIDANYGTMSSDGSLVFCVEDVGTGLASDRGPTVFMASGQLAGGRVTNRLAAYEIATQGKLAWELPADEDSELNGAFFLGAPLPLSQSLYVLAEIKGEIRLLALDARSGEVAWSQQLAVLEQNDDSIRRVAGLSPSYADGVLVCPTAAGAVVAVDLTTRSLLWGYQYHSVQAPPRSRPFRGIPITPMLSTGDDMHWFDASITLADGRALLTPRDTLDARTDEAHAELHCLDLADGKLLWKKPREDGLYIGCVHRGKVVVVGRNDFRAYELADGRAVGWGTSQKVDLPAGVLVAGRGFYNGSEYYVPLTDGEIVSLDCDIGKLTPRCRSRNGEVAGNLICFDGAVISQGVEHTECFYQLDELKRDVSARLAKHADDAEALALRGQILREEGRLAKAIDELRRSYQIAAKPRTRELLVDSLLESLRSDFTAHRPAVAELEKLIETPAERLAYLRAVATGQQDDGQPTAAFATYRKIIALGPADEELEIIDGPLACRRDRWLQARLSALRESAADDADELAAIDRGVADELKQATERGYDGLRRFLAYFDHHPLAGQARELLLGVLPETTTLLEREQLLRRLAQSADATLERSATARLAQLLAGAGRSPEAAHYYRQLSGPWAELACLDGKTGRDVAAGIPLDQETKLALAGKNAWPTGVVHKETLRGQTQGPYSVGSIDVRGPKGTFFRRGRLEYDQQQASLLGRDGLGREQWRVSLVDRSGNNSYNFNPTWSHARADGHLVLVSLGFQIMALDTLGTPGKQGPRVLWRQDLTDAMPNLGRQFGLHGQMVNMPWGQPRFVAADSLNRPVGDTGPLSDEFACFQRQRTLYAVEPVTGKLLWMRNALQPGSDLFGDGELVFVTPPGAAETIVLRTIDGAEVGRRHVPPVERRLATLGRRLLVWENTGAKAVMKLHDCWTDDDLWQHEFASAAKPWPVEDEMVAVLDRDGHFMLLDMAEGKAQIDAHLTPEPALQDIFFFRTPSRDLLVATRPFQNRGDEYVQPVPSGFGNPLINGSVHGFDRRNGKHLYTTPIANLSLSLAQPPDLPVLVFASQVQRPSRMGQQQARAMIQCIDKQTGRIVLDDQSTGPISTVDATADPEKHEVIVKTMRNTIRLTFTDEAWPAAGSGTSDGTLPERAGTAILRGMRRWLEGQTPPAEEGKER
jgi:outer membrane protein assembly factor BamB